MAELILRPDLVQRLHELAQREHRAVDEVVETLLDSYTQPVDSPSQEEILRQDRLRTYARARRYWSEHGDPRQHLSDAELEEQFWLFDENGVPRLKVDQETLKLPPNPFSKSIRAVHSDPSIQWGQPHNSSEHTKEILNTEYSDYLAARNNRPALKNDE
jgi:hypothetical protein